MRKQVTCIAAVLLAGCASINPEGWIPAQTHAPLPGVVIPSTAAEIQAHCQKVPGARACAVSDYSHGICLVYAPDDAPVWLLSHEALHCMGYSHG